MTKKLWTLFLSSFLWCCFAFGGSDSISGQTLSEQYNAMQGLENQGNYKEAVAKGEKILQNKECNGDMICNTLTRLQWNLQKINEYSKIDSYEKSILKLHPGDWEVLWGLARSYEGLQYYGFIIAGEFQRGPHRGNGGKYINVQERDQRQRLNWLYQAWKIANNKTFVTSSEKNNYASFFAYFAVTLFQQQLWKMQRLTNLAVVPDLQSGENESSFFQVGAPVDKDGKPIFFAIPKSFDAAKSDGERVRFLWAEAAKVNKNWAQSELSFRARKSKEYYSVETLRRTFFYQQKQNSASLDYLKQLELLKDHETIAHLANGIQRFTLPDEFAFVLLYQKLATEYRNVPACNELAQIYLNRRQLEKALSWCNMGLKLVDENNNWLKKKLQELKHQITGTFGEFKFDNRPLVFGSPTIIPFEYRNAKSVALTLQPVDSEKMMALYEKNIMDSESGLQDSSRLESFFAEKSVYRKFLLPAVKKWNEKLPAGRKYYSHQSDLKIVFPKPGIYLLTAEMAGGVISRIPVVCENIKIITKGLQNNELLWQVFQAKNGQPIAHQKLNFFFYRANWDPKTRKQILSHYQFSAVTDSNGAIMEDREQRFSKEFSYGGYWLCTGKYADGAFFCCASHSYFSGSNSVLEGTRSHSKAILITDRPVYRPGQKVQLKFWGQQVTYLPDVKNPFQNQVLNIVVLDPRQQQIWPPSKDKISSSTVDAKMDEYGGWNGEFTLGEDAALGTYSVVEKGMTVGSFRVEEYRKPEYEVTIDTPAKVPSLGEKIPITVQAKYYFGEPVKDGDVIVKILRYDYQDAYWPIGPWNWLYGDGYCWLAEDYCWYPHWRSWGWKRPWFPGGRRYYGGRPEVVLNMHATLDEQGEAQILLDTAMTKKFLGDRDHRYEITAEVRNKAQRTIMSQKEIVVSRKPFQVMAWTRGGYYRTGQEIQACVRSVSSNNESLKTTGRLQIYRIEYFKEKAPKETLREEFAVQTDEDGFFEQHFQIAESGQYRLAWTMKNGKDLVTGACIIGVYGKKIKDQNFQYNDLELVPDKAVYQPGETMHLRVNTAAKNSMVLLFIRPINGACPRPKYLQLDGKSLEVDIPVKGIDYPNFYVEAGTMRDGVWHHAVREIAVPPQKRKLNLELQLSETKTTPGAPASVTVCVTDSQGKPFQGSLVMTVYDKSLEYISGGSNVPDILSHFWKWKNNYQNRTGCPHWYSSLLRFEKDPANMRELGIFDGTLQRLLGVGAMDSSNVCCESKLDADGMLGGMRLAGSAGPLPTIAASFKMMKKEESRTSDSDKGASKQPQNRANVVIRTNFADTACWRGNLETDAFGKAVIPFTLPDSLTTWKVCAWAMGKKTEVGQGEAEMITAKDLMVRLVAPRFLVETDEVVLRAMVYNKMPKKQSVQVEMKLLSAMLAWQDGETTTKSCDVPAHSEKPVDWRVKAVWAGDAVVQLKVTTTENSDGLEMKFPVSVHGFTQKNAFSGAVYAEEQEQKCTFVIPAKYRQKTAKLDISWSPSLAISMADAIPYMRHNYYDSAEGTLHRFLPMVLTEKCLNKMGLCLKDVMAQKVNSEQEKKRPFSVDIQLADYTSEKIQEVVRKNLDKLLDMQCSDGGWGWFSGYHEQSSAYWTSLVMHGLLLLEKNGVPVPDNVLTRGKNWLKNYQSAEYQKILNGKMDPIVEPYKFVDNMDAFVHSVLSEYSLYYAGMADELFAGRTDLSPVSLVFMALAELPQKDASTKLPMLMRNLEQYVKSDSENGTAWLEFSNGGYWWYWYGDDIETQAMYLKLLVFTGNAKSKTARGMVKYLLNNRKNGNFWKSTRDSACVIEAFCSYLAETKEGQQKMAMALWFDDKKLTDCHYDGKNILSEKNSFSLSGEQLLPGKHEIRIEKQGDAVLYYNACVSYFSLENSINATGSEVKISRKTYRLHEKVETGLMAGSQGQALDKQTQRYTRELLKNNAAVKSGDMLEVELTLDSKNDYDYVLIEDFKAASYEPVDFRSGYRNCGGLWAYMEFHDNRVSCFLNRLYRGQNSISYRVRVENAGCYHALPASVQGVYVPQLYGNSNEFQLRVEK